MGLDERYYSSQFENEFFAFSAISQIGDREEQQDTFGYLFLDDKGLVVVCDGMGGHNGGQLASKLAAKTILDSFEKDPEIQASSLFLKDNIERIDTILHDLTDSSGVPLGAGTTIVGALLQHDLLSWVSVGDSRIYLKRGNDLVQVTQDHIYQMVLDERHAAKEISDAEYNYEASKGEALISYLGIGNIRIIDYNQEPFHLNQNDLLLLVSDGLYKYLSFEYIKDVIHNFSNITEALQSLALMVEKEAKANGLSRDNLTAAIIRIK